MRHRLLFTLVAMALAACTQSHIDETTHDITFGPVYATIADFEDDTRVELNSNKQTVWTHGDQILIFGDDEYIYECAFSGRTGDRSGSFQLTGYYSNPTTAVYDKFYAVYLFDLRIGKYSDGTPMFFTTLPETQSYKYQSYGLKTNAMLGTGVKDSEFTFKNLFSYLRLSITGGKLVERIVVMGNNNETLAGDMRFNKDGVLEWYTSSSSEHFSEITLDCGEGVQLTDKPLDFYITLPPVTLSKGINVTVYFADGTVFPKSTSKSITMERNTIQPMKTFETGGEVAWQSLTINHSGIRVYAPFFEGGTAIAGYIYWGDDYMSELNSVKTYDYNDGKEEHTITIQTVNASKMNIESCMGISEIDLTNF